MNDSAQQMRLLIVIGAKNEENQLEQTVRGLQCVCSPDIVAGIVLVFAPNATEGCLSAAGRCASERARFPIPLKLVQQTSSDIPASIRGVLKDWPEATHLLLLASDYFLESSAIADLIMSAAQTPAAIYKISRILPGGAFSCDYNRAKIILYRLFCALLRIVYHCKITDPAFVIMVAPRHLFELVQFRQHGMLIFIEWMYALLRRKVPIVEIPAVNLPRIGGSGSSHISTRLHYVTLAVAMRFAPYQSIWRKRGFRFQ